MGHYDNCRPGYCPACGAAPGNMVNGVCEFCFTKPNPLEEPRKSYVETPQITRPPKPRYEPS